MKLFELSYRGYFLRIIVVDFNLFYSIIIFLNEIIMLIYAEESGTKTRVGPQALSLLEHAVLQIKLGAKEIIFLKVMSVQFLI